MAYRFEDMTDEELKHLLWIAQECRDMRNYKAIKEEFNRRIKYD